MLQSPELVERWRITQQEYLTDIQMVLANQALDQLRLQVQQEMMQLLVAFLNRSITLKEFNARFQKKTQGSWNVFHMRGTSGGMYLNKLVKYIEDETLTSHLRSVLRLPEDTREGQRQMQGLTHYFEHLIAQQKGLRSQLQPARIPFLLSAWWHLQDAHYWPIFFPLLHLMLMKEDSQASQSDGSIEAYFAFRTRFVSLSRSLGISLWELEHLVTWKGQRNLDEQATRKITRLSSLYEWKDIVARPETVNPLSIDSEEGQQHQKSEQDKSEHTQIQWLLAKIGHQVGCEVWIAANDHSKSWNGERLGDLSLKALPPLVDSASRRVITLMEQHGHSSSLLKFSIAHGIPSFPLELNRSVETMTDEDVHRFHLFDDRVDVQNQYEYLHMGYLPHMIAQRNSLIPLVILRIIDQLEQLFPQHLSLLSILKRNFAWRLKVETTG